jgi:hypothetical protein
MFRIGLGNYPDGMFENDFLKHKKVKTEVHRETDKKQVPVMQVAIRKCPGSDNQNLHCSISPNKGCYK